jgi:hypothetical protein
MTKRSRNDVDEHRALYIDGVLAVAGLELLHQHLLIQVRQLSHVVDLSLKKMSTNKQAG